MRGGETVPVPGSGRVHEQVASGKHVRACNGRLGLETAGKTVGGVGEPTAGQVEKCGRDNRSK